MAEPTGIVADRRAARRRVWAIATPVMAANIATPLLGLVDTAVVGHMDAPHYLGAVAVGAMIFNFVFWGFGFLRMATVGLTAQAYGQGDWPEARAVLLRAGVIALAIAALLLAAQLPIREIALALLDPGEAVAGEARRYVDIRIWAAPVTLVNYALLGWFLGLQRAGYTLALQVLLNGTNILLDIAFVVGLGWGVPGVALASVAAESGATLAGVGLVIHLLRRHDSGGQWPWRAIGDRPALRRLLTLNGDLFLRTVALLGAFAWFTHLGARQGEVILAANAVLLQFLTIGSYVLDAFAYAAESLVGAAVGARDRAAFGRIVRAAAAWCVGCAALTSAVFALGGPLLIDGLTAIGEVRTTARQFLPYAAAMPVIAVAAYLLDGVFIGATATRAMRNAMLVTLAGYVALSLALMPWLGNHGLWAAFSLFMAGRAVSLWLLRAAVTDALGASPAGTPAADRAREA